MTFEAWIVCGLITGVFGMAYFVYGKKQAQWVPMVTGIALMGYPYLIDSLLWTVVIGAALLAVPFIYRPEG